MLLPGVTVAQSQAATVDLFVCSELCMDGLAAPLSQFSGGRRGTNRFPCESAPVSTVASWGCQDWGEQH